MFLGTYQDNADDKVRKGRSRQVYSSRAKLTDRKVADAFALRESGLPQRRIAERLGVCQQLISEVLHRRRWSHVQAVKATPFRAQDPFSVRSDNTSGVRGVIFLKNLGKWMAYITVKGKQTYLGSFKSLEQAATARKDAEMATDLEKYHPSRDQPD